METKEYVLLKMIDRLKNQIGVLSVQLVEAQANAELFQELLKRKDDEMMQKKEVENPVK